MNYLINNDIQEFIYSNTSTIDGIPIIIRIYGTIKNKEFYIKTQSIAPDQDTYSSFNIGEDLINNIQELNYLQQNIYFLVYRQKNEWVLCDRTIDNGFTTHLADNLLLGSRFLNDAEYQQIYNEFKNCLATKNNLLLERFNKLSIKLKEQLLNEFYSEVDLVISLKLVDVNQQPIAEQTIRRNLQKKTNDLQLDITLFADGSLKIKHKISPEYLKDYEKKWQEEANARGLKIKVKDLRQEVIAYFQSEEAQLSFGDKFLREVRTWWDDGVGNYVEAFQATQKITRHIWAVGTINRGVWHSTKEDAKEYTQWPNYMHLEPVLGGATDGLVDEIVGIPLACKSVYEIANDEEKRKSFLKVFSKDGINNLIDGFIEQATEIKKDPQRQEHFAGQTTISIASMFAGVGFVGKMGKLDELSDLAIKAVKRGDEFIEGTATLGKINELKSLAKHIEAEKVFDDLVEEFDPHTIERKLDDLINEAKSIDKSKRAAWWKKAGKFIIRGNKFNKTVRGLRPVKYKFHEVEIKHPSLKYLDGPRKGKPKRFRVDSYTHKKHIVSRKATDFNEIKLETFRGYLDELLRKYPPGAEIVARDRKIRGKFLSGDLIMEVPLINESSRRLKEFKKIMQEDKYKHIKLEFQKE